MKTIYQILVILLVGALVAGALYLTVENTSLLSDAGAGEFGARPEQGTDGEMPARPEGDHDHHEASLSRGLAGVGASLAKIGMITLIVLGIQWAFTQLKKHLTIQTGAAS